MSKSIAIITARGGSKRIPKKNIKEFCGKPIICYSIEAALQSGIFDEVMVSTDCEEIAEIAKAAGAKVPFLRSEATSNDYATTANVLKEVLEKYKELGKQFDQMCCLYPTAPFITAQKLADAAKVLEEQDVYSVMPVVSFSFPPQRAFVNRNGVLEYQYPQYANTRSQDLEPIYHDCGQFYFVYTDKFTEYGSLVTPKTAPIVMPEEEVQDIDNLSDWMLAEIKFQMLKEKECENSSIV